MDRNRQILLASAFHPLGTSPVAQPVRRTSNIRGRTAGLPWFPHISVSDSWQAIGMIMMSHRKNSAE